MAWMVRQCLCLQGVQTQSRDITLRLERSLPCCRIDKPGRAPGRSKRACKLAHDLADRCT